MAAEREVYTYGSTATRVKSIVSKSVYAAVWLGKVMQEKCRHFCRVEGFQVF